MHSFVRIIIVMVVFASISDATPYHWRLTKAQALAIAERAMVAEHFDPARYPERRVDKRETDHEWHILFSVPMSAAPDSRVIVIVRDQTGDAGVGGWLYYPRSGFGKGVSTREYYSARREGKYLATIDPATGRVTKVEIARSCGSPALDVSAQRQILQWRARPHGYTKVYVPVSFGRG